MNRTALGLAIGAGYVLGRTKKMKMALAVGSLVAGKKLNLSPRALGDLVNQQLKNNPQFKEIGDQLRQDLRGVGKAASGAMAERQMNALADRLHGRTAQVRDRLSGVVPDTGSDSEDSGEARDEEPGQDAEEAHEEQDEPEDRDAEAGDESRAPGKRAAKKAPAKKAAPAAKKAAAPAKKAAAKKAPARKAPAKKTAKKTQAASRAAAKKTAAAGAAGRSRQPKGGDEG